MTFRSEIAALVETAFAPTPVHSDENLKIDPPVDGRYVRLTFRDGAEGQASFGGAGGNLYREPRLVFVDAFVPTDTGDRRAVEMIDLAKETLRDVVADGARWERFEAGPEGEAEGEYRKQLIAIFRRAVRV